MENEVKLKFNNEITNLDNLKEYEKTLTNIKKIIGKLPKNFNINTSEYEKQINNINNSLDTTNNKLNDIQKVSKVAFNYTALKTFLRGLKNITKEMSSLVKKASDYGEDINLFQVAFDYDPNYREAERFVNTMTEMYGLDEDWLTRTTGIFKQLSNAMKLSVEQGTKLSKIMTQMSLDISSLYNLDVSKGSSVLQSALAGQTRPIRGATGADITQATLQQTLNELGIDQTITNLSYAEKRLVIIISLTRQLQTSVNDMAKTIEQPANQTRIMREQWERLTRAVGNVFLPIVKKVLPYVNAILMVMTEILNIVARLFGYRKEDFNAVAGVADSVLDLEDGLDGASESAEKLKRGLRSFDKLNNITTPTSSSSGVGASGLGGIDPKIWSAFNDAYDSYFKKLSNVNMEATKIRDRIMEWLGFTKLIDEETKDVSFKFDHITGGTVLGALAVGGIIFIGIKKIVDMLKTIKGITGIFKGKSNVSDVASEVAETISGSSKISSATKKFEVPNVKTVLKGMADLAIIVGGVVVLVEAIGLLNRIPYWRQNITEGIDTLKEVFWGIASISPPLLGLSVAMGIMGSIGVSSFAKGLADFAIVVGGTTGVVTAIGALLSIPYFKDFAMTGTDMLIKVFQGLWDIAVPLLGFTGYLLLMGLATPAPIALGLAGFAIVVGGLTTVLVALGALKQIEGFDWIVNEGGIVLSTLGKTIGEFAGSIVAGFVGKSFEGLEDVGTHLTNFMINATPFFERIGKVDNSSTEAVKNLASCILMLTASDLINGITRWLTGDTTSFEKFGKDLEAFAPHFKNYSEQIKGIDNETVIASANSAKALAQFAKELPNEGGVLAFYLGDNTLVKFSSYLPAFGKNLKTYSNNVSSLDTSVVKNSAESAKSIAELAKNLPNEGGLLSFYVGDNTLDKFSSYLPVFGTNMKKFSDNIKGIDNNVVDNTTKSAKSIAELAKNLPNSGGIVSWFTGDNKLSDLGLDLSKFGGHFKDYYNKIKDISLDKINQVTNGLKEIINMFITVKNNNLMTTMNDFANSLKNVANQSKNYFESSFSWSNGNNIGYNFGSGFANGMVNAIKNKKFPILEVSMQDGTSMGKYNIRAYADGGLPPVGQIFVANDRGAELVGNIGGQSFVANQNQVVDLLDRKLADAGGGIQNATFVVQVGDEKIGEVMLNNLQKMAKSNGKPITIGV